MMSEPADTEPTVKASRAGEAERVVKQTAAEEPRAEAVTFETPPPPPTRTVTIVDGTSGKRQEIVIPAPAEDEPRAQQPSLRQGPRPESRK